jgi:hypothetical protein
MKTSTKWILGIGIGIVVGCILLTVVGGAGYWALNRSGLLGWEMGARSGRLWDSPLTPNNGMPMHAYPGFYGSWSGFFSPLRYLAFPLICLGFLALIVLGIIALVRSSNKSRPAEAPQVAVPAPAPAPVQVVAEAPAQAAPAAAKNCPNCGREVQEDWANCPYCGAPLG